MRESDSLFTKFDLSAVLEAQKAKVREVVETADEDAVLEYPARVAEETLEALSIAPLELHVDRASVAKEETQIDVSSDQRRAIFDRSRPCYVPGTVVRYYVPFSGEANLFRAHPNEYDFNPPRGVVENGELVLCYEVEGAKVSETKVEYEHDLGRIKTYVGRVNAMVEAFNAVLPGMVQQQVAVRQQRLAQAQKGLEELGLPIRGR